jgi:hypothetical protein
MLSQRAEVKVTENESVPIKIPKKIEKAQERALRFVYDDYTSSYINILEKALVPSIQIRRIRTMVLETYKIPKRLSIFSCCDAFLQIELI